MPRSCPLLVFIFFLLAPYLVHSQNFKPGTRLWVMPAGHFEFIYSAESERTARKLAARAESIYDRVSGLLGIDIKRTIPVVITPHTGLFNAYMNPVPYPHIVLFDTPQSLEWTSFENSLESLFLHELTHAVSGNTRSPGLEKLQSVFGWVYPAAFNAPWFMLEGVSVSFESLDTAANRAGLLGRANDPLVKQRLRQNIHENVFKTPFQTTGVWDLPPGGTVYYEYGGLFSAYLQTKYGMEHYARLWQEIGRKFRFSMYYYESGVSALFKDVYDIPLLDAWNDFKEGLRLEGLLENNKGVLYGKKSTIADVAGGGGTVYFLDSHAGKLFACTPQTGTVRAAVSLDSSAYSLDISKDGQYALVSTYLRRGANQGQLARPQAVEYQLKTGRKTGRQWSNLYQARYFRDGVAGIQPDTHLGNLVYLPAAGEAEILLRGSEELLFSTPAPINDTWMAFTSGKKGVRQLSFYNYETKAVYQLKTDLKDDTERWRYMRGLRFSGGKLLFSYDHDDRMYKLASVDLGGLGESGGNAARFQVYFAEKDFSGGVFNAVSLDDGSVYYRASFSIWDSLMSGAKLGEDGGLNAPARLEPWEQQWSGSALARKADPVELPFQVPPRPFSSLKYLNPFNLWLPYPQISVQPQDITINGIGIFSYIADPADTNLIFLTAGFDWKYLIAPASVMWRNFALTFPLEIQLSDSVDDSLQLYAMPWRVSSASINAQLRFPLGSEWLNLYITPSVYAAAFSWSNTGDKTEAAKSTAYRWNYHELNGSGTLGVTLTSMRKFSWELFGTGLSGSFAVRKPAALSIETGIFTLHSNRYELILRGAVESLPFLPFFGTKATLYGAFDKTGMTIQGASPFFENAFFESAAVKEYGFKRAVRTLQWLTGTELELRLFSLEIQKNLSHFYFNRLHLSAAWHLAYFGHQAAAAATLGSQTSAVHSVLCRLEIPVSMVPVTVVPVKIAMKASYAYKLTPLEASPQRSVFDFSVSVDY